MVNGNFVYTKLSRRQYPPKEFPKEDTARDLTLGHAYSHSTERNFYHILQAAGIRHVQNPKSVLRSKTPCYTVNTGSFIVPILVKGRWVLREWFPDAIIRLPDGNTHFVELKSHTVNYPDKYNNFIRCYTWNGAGAKPYLPSRLGTDDRDHLETAIRDFRGFYGARRKTKFHMLTLRHEPQSISPSGTPIYFKINGVRDRGLLRHLFLRYEEAIPPRLPRPEGKPKVSDSDSWKSGRASFKGWRYKKSSPHT